MTAEAPSRGTDQPEKAKAVSGLKRRSQTCCGSGADLGGSGGWFFDVTPRFLGTRQDPQWPFPFPSSLKFSWFLCSHLSRVFSAVLHAVVVGFSSTVTRTLGLTNAIAKAETRLTSCGLQILVYLLFVSRCSGVTHRGRPSIVLLYSDFLALTFPIVLGNGEEELRQHFQGVQTTSTNHLPHSQSLLPVWWLMCMGGN